MARTFVLRIEGKEYDVDDMTLDEMIAVQDLCGDIAFSDLEPGNAKHLRAMAFVMRQRDQPDVTLDAIGAIKGLELIAGEEEMPPLPPSDEAAGNQNGSSTPDDSGAHPSPASTPGSAPSTSAS